MTALAVTAVLVASRMDVYRNRALFDACLLICEFALPVYLLLSFRRVRTGAELVSVILALAYMGWGGVMLFAPRPPGPYVECYPGALLSRFHEIIGAVFHPGVQSRYPEVWWLVRRWNWALVAIFYMNVLADIVVCRHCTGMSQGDSSPALTTAPRKRALSVVGLVTSAGIGMAVGLLLGWGYYTTTPSLAQWDRDPSSLLNEPWTYFIFAVCVLGVVAVLMGLSFRRRRRQTRHNEFPFGLALYWGFAVSVQLVETPYVPPPGRVIHRSIKPSASTKLPARAVANPR